jgi:hypothetical protein
MKTDRDGAWIVNARAAFAARGLVDPPDSVRERARALFRARQTGLAARTTSPTTRARVHAAFMFDSSRQAVRPTGVRSAGAVEGPWQLLYRRGDVDIDLLVRPNQDGRTLNVRGQALSLVGDGIGAGIVEALPSGPRTPRSRAAPSSMRSEVEASGEFALANLERGRYDVLLRFGTREIELRGVEF